MVQNTFLNGPGAAETSIEVLRERYDFIARAMAKIPGLNTPELIDAALLEYRDIRDRSATATLGPDAIPGWRVMVLQRDKDLVYFSGVREDGALLQGYGESEYGLQNKTAHEVARRVSKAFAVVPDEADQAALESNGALSEAFKKSYVEATSDDPGDRFVEFMNARPVDGILFRQMPWLALSAYSNSIQRSAQWSAGHECEQLTQFIFEKHAETLGSSASSHGERQVEEGLSEKDKKRFHGAIYTALKKSSGRRHGAMAERCRRALDPETAKIMSSLADHSGRLANWLSGAFLGDDGEVRVNPILARNRRQACQSYPILGRYFLNHRRDSEIGYAIDLGEELSRPLAEALETSPAVIKRLAGLTWQKAGRPAFLRTDDFIERLGLIDLTHIPQDRKGFADWRATTSAAIDIGWATGNDIKDLVAAVGNRFSSVAKDLVQNPPEGVGDMRDDIERRLLRPAVAQRLVADGEDRDTARWTAMCFGRSDQEDNFTGYNFGRKLFAGHSLRSALKASERWHRALGRINETLGDGSEFSDPKSRSWDPLVGEIELKNGLRLVELPSLRDLRMEGVRQNHCVGGYGPEVKNGSSMIFSLRKGDDIVSTIEVERKWDEKGQIVYSIGQNMGKSNADMAVAARQKDPLGKLAKSAERALLQGLRSLDPACEVRYQAGLAEAREHQGSASMNELAGYDIFDRKGLELAFATLKEYLPKAQSKMTLDAWVDHLMAEPGVRSSSRSGVSLAEQEVG